MVGKCYRPLTLAALALSLAGATVSAWAQGKHHRAAVVQQDLENAMKGEALAYAKYMMFARSARDHGHPEVAALFERTAQTERMEHFREHAELAGVGTGTDADNLRSAIDGERYETSRMYPEMAARARKAGDLQAARRFEEIGRDESKHHDQFAAALAQLERSPAKAAATKR